MSWKFNIFFCGLWFWRFPFHEQTNKYYQHYSINSSKQNFVLALLTLILYFFCSEPKLPLIPQVGPSPSTKKLFLLLPVWDHELLATSKISIFLGISLLKLHEPALSNVIPYPLYTYFSLSRFFTRLVFPNKQFLNLKLIVGFIGQIFKSSNYFVLQWKDLYQILFQFYIQKVLWESSI